MKSAQATVLVLCWALIALGHKLEGNQDVSRLSVPVRLPPVPSVKGAGADGLPELPKVETLATMFFNQESSVNSEAKMFVSRLRSIQKVETTKLGQLKSAYDQKLKSQEKANQVLVKTNAGLARQVMAQSKANEQIKAQLKRLDRRIAARRQQLQALEQRFVDGRKFMKSALSATDDTKEMSLLEVTVPKVQSSFLEVSSATHEHEEPEVDQDQPEVQQVQGTDAEDQQQGTTEFEASESTPMSFLELDSESQIVHKRSLRLKKSKAHRNTQQLVITQTATDPAAPAQVEAVGSDPSNSVQTLTQPTELEAADPENSASSEGVVVLQAQEAAPEAKAVTSAIAEKSKDDDDGTSDASLVKMFSESLHKMREGAKNGKDAMKSKFQSSYRDGVARQKALQEQQKVLESSLKTLKAKTQQLQQAEAALKTKLAGLEKTLAKGGAFLNSLSKVASARVEEVPETVKNEVATPLGDLLSQ